MKIIGVAGKIASGKTTSAEIMYNLLKEKGCNVFRTSLSDILRDVLYDNVNYANVKIDWPNKEWERKNLIEFGKELKKRYHNSILVELAIKKAEHYNAGVLIIDGVRTYDEANFVRNNGGILIYIDAMDVIRFKRVKERNSEKDKNIKTLRDFRKMDSTEEKLYKVGRLQALANIVIINEGSLDCLKHTIEKIVSRLDKFEGNEDPQTTHLFVC